MQRFIAIRSKRQQLAGNITTIRRPLFTPGPAAAYTYTSLLFLLILLTTIFVSSLWPTLSTTNSDSKVTAAIATAISNQTVAAEAVSATVEHNRSAEKQRRRPRKRFEAATLNCTSRTGGNQTCSTNNYPTRRLEAEEEVEENPKVCPEYFRWIHADLSAWSKGRRKKGITREMVEAAKKTAHFGLVVKDGRAYVERYKKSIQTRDVFSIWGILQLLRRYPGMVPDLELMFDCDDRPVILTRDYPDGPNVTGPPPLFRYCGDRWTHDIVFPDWSFWGWAEINIRPWEHLLEEIKIGNNRIKWKDREAYAYWKGNPFVDETRQDLLKCNASDSQDWNARLFVQDWIKESQQGFNQSNLANQCAYRYKIYIEGYAWSVSEKYILACDSVTLIVKPRFYDFFVRSLQPTQHYWPIRDTHKCKSIKHAVHWGNTHKQKAEEIGRAASRFIQQELKMDYVYDYMFHLLNEYAKLLKFEPRVPEGAEEVCAEAMACTKSGSEKEFMIESMVKEPSTKGPCSLPPPFDPTSLRIFYANKNNLISRVERWEDNYWRNRSTHHQHTHL